MPVAGHSDQSVPGISVAPGKLSRYTVPVSWILHGRSGSTRSDAPRVVPEAEKIQRKRGRVISRYWSAVGWLWFVSRYWTVDLGKGRKLRARQAFLTLTIPGRCTADHRQVKALILDKFFTYCRNVLGLRDYVWTAELQQRGEIHFHCIINQYLPKDRVREAWNRICAGSGIVEMSERGDRPSTEIEAVKSYNGSRSYAAKYLGKALDSGEIGGHVWGGSRTVTGIGSKSTNAVDQDFPIDQVTLEVEQCRPRWRHFDRGISVAYHDVAWISRRRTPTLYRLLQRHHQQHINPDQHHGTHQQHGVGSVSASIGQGPGASGATVLGNDRGSSMDRSLQGMAGRVAHRGMLARFFRRVPAPVVPVGSTCTQYAIWGRGSSGWGVAVHRVGLKV